jgi:hypothetical protein
MRIARVLAVALVAFPLVARAQARDSIVLGERVRVLVAATRGDRNLFIGNVDALSHDTLTLAIPGGKGTIILPRASISEVARSDGRESHFRNLPVVLPSLVLTVMFASLPTPSSSVHPNALRNERYLLLGVNGFLIARMLGRTPPERWRPLYSWLDRP